jgi:hypothetical protein
MRKAILLPVLLCCFLAGQSQVNEAEKNLALQLVKNNSSVIGIRAGDIDNSEITGTYIIPGSDIRMVHLQQSFQSVLVYNRLHVLAFRNGQAVSVTGYRIPEIASRIKNPMAVPAIDFVDAVKTALAEAGLNTKEKILPLQVSRQGQKIKFGTLGVSSENILAELLWFPLENDQELRLAWQVFVAPLKNSAYWLIRVDAITNKVISKEDLTISCNWGDQPIHQHAETKKNTNPLTPFKGSDPSITFFNPFVVNTATYRVVRYPAESPQHPGGSPVTHTDPWLMSPGNATTLGWHNDGANSYDSTRGNNAFAYEDRDANNIVGRSALSTTPQPNLSFDFNPDFTQEPVIRSPAPNQQFNTTNLFYWNNLMHDLSYIYGFTETAKNYQNDNMGRGGVGGDYVLAEAQDGSGTNNANFSSGVEGTRGRMQMFLWPSPTPDRDGDADNGVIAHEYTHGISNRMTGTGAGCLNTTEQMGEGWSDYFGLMITHNWATAQLGDGYNNPRGIGTYVLNQPVNGPGIRQYRYTTNMAINPMTYGNLPSVAVPHGVGTIWCTALWDMTWYIIQEAGINPNLFDPTGTGGNSIALKLVTEGLRLQPCGPGFIDGRNAILKADTLFFGAQYSCAIIEAFARRGMGMGASQGSPNVRGDETLSFVNGTAVYTTQPQSVNVCAGSNHTFTVAATGANVRYQWQVSTDGGATYNDIPGATAATLPLTGITPGMNNYRYRVIATGCPPAVTSSIAILTVVAPPSITAQPADVAVCEPATASFSVTATGTTNYQWQLSIDGGLNFANIPAATSSTLNLGAVNVSMNGYRYRVLLTNATCTTPVASAAAILTVNTSPTITTQPTDKHICTGGSNSFTVTATSSQPVIYQWQVSTDGINWSNITNGGIYSGATSATLTISGATTAQNGYRYRVLVWNAACTTPVPSNPAQLSVHNLPTVTLSAAPYTSLFPGQQTTLTATPVGSGGTLSFSWFYNNNSLVVPGNTYVVNIEKLGSYQVGVHETWPGNVVCSNLSNVVAIGATISDKLFIFPSPNNGRFTVSYYNYTGADTQRRIVIFSAKGEKVYDRMFPITGPYTLLNIDLRNAQRGIYIVMVGDITGKRLVEGKVHVW